MRNGAVIRIDADAAGYPCQGRGQYLSRFDPEARRGRGKITTTADPTRAMIFSTHEEALACWRRQSTVRPLRDDLEPNRPLTAFTISILSVADALQGMPW